MQRGITQWDGSFCGSGVFCVRQAVDLTETSLRLLVAMHFRCHMLARHACHRDPPTRAPTWATRHFSMVGALWWFAPVTPDPDKVVTSLCGGSPSAPLVVQIVLGTNGAIGIV